MPKVVFVILHYLTIKDTYECVESIKNNIDYENYEIVIVDNASNNNSYEDLLKLYSKEEYIHLISNKENLGFAKGNNIGYGLAKDKLKAEFIIIINNDTILDDVDFIKNIIKYYRKNKVHVLGPKIISLKDNINQNPLENIIDSKMKLIRNIVKYSMLYMCNITNIEKFIKKIRYKNKVNVIENKKVESYNNKILLDVPLHGSCLIFSPLYIESMDYAFYPNTFLFVEEDILYYLCKKNKFITCYFPNATIKHKEDSSTNFWLNTDEKKRRFIYKNILKSSIEFYKLISNISQLKVKINN